MSHFRIDVLLTLPVFYTDPPTYGGACEYIDCNGRGVCVQFGQAQHMCLCHGGQWGLTCPDSESV